MTSLATRILAIGLCAFACVVEASPKVLIGVIGKPYADFSTPPSRPVTIRAVDLATGSSTTGSRDCTVMCVAGGRYGYADVLATDHAGRHVFLWAFGWSSGAGATVYGVSKIDALTAEVAELLPEPLPVRSLATTPFREGFVSFSSYNDARLAWYTTSPLDRTLEVPLGAGDPTLNSVGPAVSADGESIYVFVADRLKRLDASNGSVLAERTMGFAGSLAVDPFRARLYAVDYLNERTLVLDADTLQEIDSHVTQGIGDLLVDRRGMLMIDTISTEGERRTLVVEPDTWTIAADVALAGRGFIKGQRHGRFYRVGREFCEIAASACGSDVVIEFDSKTLEETRRYSLDERAVEDPSRKDFRYLLEWLVVLPVPAVAIEFHHDDLDHYFLTADTNEIDALDRGVFSGWRRTGESFNAMRSDAGTGASYVPMCRFYGRPERGLDSHFYSASLDECDAVAAGYDGAWVRESDDAFYVVRANETTGACPEGTRPVYRLWNARFDSNHRYTTSPTIKAEMIERGYVPEGYGPDKVAFCVRA